MKKSLKHTPLPIPPDAALETIKALRKWLKQEMQGKIKPCSDYTPGCINCTTYILDGMLEEEQARMEWEAQQETTVTKAKNGLVVAMRSKKPAKKK